MNGHLFRGALAWYNSAILKKLGLARVDCGRHSGTAAWTVVDTVRRVVNARPTPGRHLGATWNSTWAPRGTLLGRTCGDTWVSGGRQVVDSFPPGRRDFSKKIIRKPVDAVIWKINESGRRGPFTG